jgi:hypothetical protein
MFTQQPDSYPEEWIGNSEEGELIWMAQMMLIEWKDGFTETVAVGYIVWKAWEAVRRERKVIN